MCLSCCPIRTFVRRCSPILSDVSGMIRILTPKNGSNATVKGTRPISPLGTCRNHLRILIYAARLRAVRTMTWCQFHGSSRRKSCGKDDGEIVHKLNCVHSITLNEKKIMLVLRIWRAYFVPRVIDCTNELSEIPLSRDSECPSPTLCHEIVLKNRQSFMMHPRPTHCQAGSTTRE
jgi:hypothetical protein